jgi:hypothetical protein
LFPLLLPKFLLLLLSQDWEKCWFAAYDGGFCKTMVKQPPEEYPISVYDFDSDVAFKGFEVPNDGVFYKTDGNTQAPTKPPTWAPTIAPTPTRPPTPVLHKLSKH